MGLTRVGSNLRIDPCFPKAWPVVEMRLTLGPAPCTVRVLNQHGSGKGVMAAHLNGAEVTVKDGVLILPLAQLQGQLTIDLGLG